MHVWADVHNRLENAAQDEFTLHLIRQGQAVEALAQEFLPVYLSSRYPGAEIRPQAVAVDGHYYARVDALVIDPASGACDIYEIKSSTSTKTEHLEDATFQALVVGAQYALRDVYIVHVNGTYTRTGDLDLASFFTIVNVSQEVDGLREQIETARADAWHAAQQAAPDGLENCSKPSDCPCPSLCFPDLPAPSIFNLPRLGRKARELQNRGILALEAIPADVGLSPMQDRHRHAAVSGRAYVDTAGIRAELDRLAFPLYFLDYETFNPVVPRYDGYHPYEHMVFQYSLHTLDAPGGLLRHHEFLAQTPGDPEAPLLESLSQALGPGGTVIVWNKTFEMGRNKEMGLRLPPYRSFLEDVNLRVYDLMEIFRQGLYVDGAFCGSASIKYVLPVLVPELDYQSLTIRKGDQAMLEWDAMVSGKKNAEECAETASALLAYCHLDTLAMVRIWEFLRQI